MTVRGDAVPLPRSAQVQRAVSVLEREPEAARRLVALATRLLGVRYGFLSLVGEVEEVFQAVTAPPDRGLPTSLPLRASVCRLLVASGEPLVVADLAVHPGLRLLEEVQQLGLRSYAGVPVCSADGTVLGGFCVADEVPRAWSEEDVRLLLDLAAAHTSDLQLRTALADVARARAREQARAAQGAALHRVALAVARAEAPDEVLALAAEELQRLPGVLAGVLVRDAGPGRRAVAAAGRVPDGVLALAARLLDEAERTGAAALGELGGVPAAVVPLAVQERHWGCVLVLTRDRPQETSLQRLHDLVGLVVGTTDAQERLLSLARTDPLTGVLNRRGFDEQLAAELERDRRGGGVLTLALLDVDRFKEVNDVHGHAGGDAVLRALVERVRLGLRAGDVVGRPGGDEFALLLPGTDARTARRVLERVREQVAAAPLAGASVTVSVGAATTTDGRARPGELTAVADRALYEVKDAGRDGVRVLCT